MTAGDIAPTRSLVGARSRAEFGSDYIVELLRALNIEFAAFNPGSSFRGIHDSLVNFEPGGAPEVIECCHEEISVAIAHGYAKAAGRPMVAIAHNVVGLQHATMAIFNAWVDRVPILVLGGTGPVDPMRRRPRIDWIHTANVQGNLVRDFVKWDDQPPSLTACAEALTRAYKAATTAPTAPVYVCFDTELQEQRVEEELFIPDVTRYATGSPVAPDPTALDRAAALLVASQRPVIVADGVGRTPAAVPALVSLAESLGAPVIEAGDRFSMPTTHPLDTTGGATEALREADVVLLLGVQDPYGALTTVNRVLRTTEFVQSRDCKIISVGVGDLLVRSWTGDYQRQVPTDLAIVAEPGVAIPLLLGLVRERLTKDPGARDRFSSRGAGWADKNRERRVQWRAGVAATAERSPMALPFVAQTVWDVIKDEDWMLANGSLNGWARRLWNLREPHQYLGGSGGAGLGYGMGASIGAALAARNSNRLVVNFQADGDLLFTPAAFWTAAHHRVPMLAVLHNNRSLYNSEEHGIQIAEHRDRPVERAGIGTQITDPNVDFAMLARSFDCYGEGPIERPADLKPAIERALRVVKDQGKLAVVDVVCEAR
jgi:thiamine pyrophosphate-dependent acetolactate synthase large subunit-like protein